MTPPTPPKPDPAGDVAHVHGPHGWFIPSNADLAPVYFDTFEGAMKKLFEGYNIPVFWNHGTPEPFADAVARVRAYVNKKPYTLPEGALVLVEEKGPTPEFLCEPDNVKTQHEIAVENNERKADERPTPRATATPLSDAHFAGDIVRDRGEETVNCSVLSMLYFARALETQLAETRAELDKLSTILAASTNLPVTYAAMNEAVSEVELLLEADGKPEGQRLSTGVRDIISERNSLAAEVAAGREWNKLIEIQVANLQSIVKDQDTDRETLLTAIRDVRESGYTGASYSVAALQRLFALAGV